MQGLERELGRNFVRLAPSGPKDSGSTQGSDLHSQALEQRYWLQAPPALVSLIRRSESETAHQNVTTPTDQEFLRFIPKVRELHTFSTRLLRDYGSEHYEKLPADNDEAGLLQFTEHYFFATPPVRVSVDDIAYDVRLVEQGARRAPTIAGPAVVDMSPVALEAEPVDTRFKRKTLVVINSLAVVDSRKNLASGHMIDETNRAVGFLGVAYHISFPGGIEQSRTLAEMFEGDPLSERNIPPSRYFEPDPNSPRAADVRLKSYGFPVWKIIGYYIGSGQDVAQVAHAYKIPEQAVRVAADYYLQNRAVIDDRLDPYAARKALGLPLEGIQEPSKPLVVETKEEIKPATANTLEGLITRQVDRFIQLGFHDELGLTEESYRRSLAWPEGLTQPETYRGRFDIPLIVDPRISLSAAHRKAEIVEYIDTEAIQNVTPPQEGPYLAWTHDASKYRPYSVEKALTMLAKDEVASPQIEVTSLYLARPDIFRDHAVDAAGSRDEDGLVPYLYAFFGRPEVNARWFDRGFQLWGALSRGKDVVLLGTKTS